MTVVMNHADVAGAIEALDYIIPANEHEGFLASTGEVAARIAEVVDAKKAMSTVLVAGALAATGIVAQPSVASAAERPTAVMTVPSKSLDVLPQTGMVATPAAVPMSSSNKRVIVEKGASEWSVVADNSDLLDPAIPGAIKQLEVQNNLGEHPVLHPGDQLDVEFLNHDKPQEVPTGPQDEYYTVQRGDSLWGIWARTGKRTSIDQIRAQNNMAPGAKLIFAGQRLLINKAPALPPPPPAPVVTAAPIHEAIKTEAEKPSPVGNFVSWPFQKGQNILTLVGLVARTEQVAPDTAYKWIKEQNPAVKDLSNIAPETPIKLPGITNEKWAPIWESVVHLAAVQKLNDAVAAQRLPEQSSQLAARILTHPNIQIEAAPNDRVRRSIQDIEDDSRTFVHDVSGDNNNETAVSPALLQALIKLADAHSITIDSLTTGWDHVNNSDHYRGEAVDLAAKENATEIFKFLYDHRVEFQIDDLIYAYPPEGTTTLDGGQAATFDANTINNHRNHIHFSVQGQTVILQPQPIPVLPPATSASPATPVALHVPVATTSPEAAAFQPFSLESNVLSKSGLSASQIDAILAKHMPAMSGLGNVIADVEAKTGISAWMLMGHAEAESGGGTSQMAREKKNLYGRNAYDTNPGAAISNNSFAGSIYEYAAFLKYYYLTPPSPVPDAAIMSQWPHWKSSDTPGMYWGGDTTLSAVFKHYSTSGQTEAKLIVDIVNNTLQR